MNIYRFKFSITKELPLDRLLNGSVLDFLIINYNQIYFPAVFNVADIFISFGALLIITSYVFRPNK